MIWLVMLAISHPSAFSSIIFFPSSICIELCELHGTFRPSRSRSKYHNVVVVSAISTIPAPLSGHSMPKWGFGYLSVIGKMALEIWMIMGNFCCPNVWTRSSYNKYNFQSEGYKFKGTWRHPRSGHWHLINYINVRKRDLKDVRITKAYMDSECWTDHRLVISKMKMHLRPNFQNLKRRYRVAYIKN